MHADVSETSDDKTLCLFLGNQDDIDICTAFWNTRWIYSINKLFLDKEAFLQDINLHINLITQGMPLIRAIAVFVTANQEEASNIYQAVKQAFSNIDRNLCVRVQYRDLKYKFFNGKLSYDDPNTFTRQIYLDDSVRFIPNPPLGHEQSMLFGFDAEVNFASGIKFSLPSTSKTSELLSNELERLKRAEESGDTFYLKESVIRATDKGITGITKGGTECHLYIHPKDIFVDYYLKSLGFQVRLNKLTQYAQGFIKKLGGFDKAIRLVNNDGLRIISILNDEKAFEAGLGHTLMMCNLGKILKDKQKALNLIHKFLPEILSSELVRRGYALTCKHCDLKAWYSIQ